MVGGQADDVEAGTRRECRRRVMDAMLGQSSLITAPLIIAQPALTLALSRRRADFGVLESIHHRKTGAMIRVSLRLGAMVAGAADGELAALDAYGRCLGLAFQITDDLLDVQSSEAADGQAGRQGRRAGETHLSRPTRY